MDRQENGPTSRARMHVPIMVREVLEHLRPSPGDLVVDCTLGGGGHAEAILPRIQPGGRLIGLDADPIELPRTEVRLRQAGFGPDALLVLHGNFRDLRAILGSVAGRPADAILVDLGVSSMQHDTAGRGFSYKRPGPLDLRHNPSIGRPASELLASLDEAALRWLLLEHSDEPDADVIARLLTQHRPVTTHALERTIRVGLSSLAPTRTKSDIKMSVRRTFQALRILVNDELKALDTLLQTVPDLLAPGGRFVALTFQPGEDRRLERFVHEGRTAGVFADTSRAAVRSGKAETFSNRRAASARLWWAVRSQRKTAGDPRLR